MRGRLLCGEMDSCILREQPRDAGACCRLRSQLSPLLSGLVSCSGCGAARGRQHCPKGDGVPLCLAAFQAPAVSSMAAGRPPLLAAEA